MDTPYNESPLSRRSLFKKGFARVDIVIALGKRGRGGVETVKPLMESSGGSKGNSVANLKLRRMHQ